MNRDLILGRALPQAAQPPPAAVQVAQPLNDTQLVALVAAHRTDVPAVEAVGWAVDIVVEAIRQTPGLAAKLRQGPNGSGGG